MSFVARYGFLLLVLAFCGCFNLSIALLVVAFCWYEKPKRATKGKKGPNGNQALLYLGDLATVMKTKKNMMLTSEIDGSPFVERAVKNNSENDGDPQEIR